MAHIDVDGVPHQVGEGTLLSALRSLGIDVPTLCHDDRLQPHPVCRMCVVEVEGSPRPVPSCATPVTDGMVVRTASPQVLADRRAVLRLLAARVSPDVLAGPETPFARLLREHGLAGEVGPGGAAPPVGLRDASHPYLHVDMSRCIACLRCVRICDEVQGQLVWKVWNRGDRIEIHPDSGTTLLASSCVSCGACVTSCPTGALEDQSVRARGPARSWTRTTCPYCGVGCELEVGVDEGAGAPRIVQVLPTMDAPVNRGHLCVKGRYAFDFTHAGDRLTVPLVRRPHGRLEPVTWPEAVAFVAERLRRILAESGGESIGVLGSARATNEECYVAQKLARVVLRTNNVDCCARVCHAPSARALSVMLGTGAATSCFDDIELAETILVAGANATEGHPVVGARIKQRARAGASLIVVDPRAIELTRLPSALHLPVRPGANIALFHSMAAVLFEEGLVDEAFVRDRVDGLDAFREHVRDYRPEAVADVCGVRPELVRQAARLYARRRPAIAFHGLGLTEHGQGTMGVMSLVNLALLTGNVGKPGSGLNPLRGQNNVQGAAHMGCEPSGLTGLVSLDEGAARFEQVYGAPVPRAPGKTMPAMMDAAARGELRALWAMGYDVLLTNPRMAATRKALEALELLVVQDIFLSETARELAHVVLPSASAFEKDGTFMNAERRVQRVRRVVPPPGQARPDYVALCEVARALGHEDGFTFASAEEIWDEVRAVWPVGRGITYERLARGGLQWPCPTIDHPGTPRLHADAFGKGRRATLRCVRFAPTGEQPSPELPFVLTTGRALYQFNAGTMTMRTPNRTLRPTDTLDIAPVDADALGLAEGAEVRVTSRWGSAVLPIHRSDRMRPGELFATFHDARRAVNALTSDIRDSMTDTPEYKVTAVRIEPVGPLGRGPGSLGAHGERS